MFGGFWLTVPTVADIFLFGGAAPQHSFSTWQGFMNSQVSHSRSLYITERVRRFTQQSSGHDVNVPRLDEKRLMREDILVTLDQRACFPRSLIPQLEFQGRGSSGGRQWQASQVWSFCFRCLSESDRATGSPQVPTSSHEMQVVMRTLMKRVGICIHMALQSGLSHANVFLASCLDLF